MIDEVHITDLALIHNVSLTFDKGLTVITGETGSGKSALLKGLRLLLGERATKESIREGCARTCVEGRFFIDGENAGASDEALTSANVNIDAATSATDAATSATSSTSAATSADAATSTNADARTCLLYTSDAADDIALV